MRKYRKTVNDVKGKITLALVINAANDKWIKWNTMHYTFSLEFFKI